MTRDELTELHYIVHMDNILSIRRLGILSNSKAAKVAHTSVAMREIQDRRADVVVPRGRRLHEYVNLYVCARNPMLFRLKAQHMELCVLRISTEVLDLSGVVIADGNASSDYVRFAEAPGGLRIVDQKATFAEYWTDMDPIVQWQKKTAKCAEILIPDNVASKFILGAYVSCPQSIERFNCLRTGIPVSMNGHMFFLR